MPQTRYSGAPTKAGRTQELDYLIKKYAFQSADSGAFTKVNYNAATDINSTLAAIAAANNGVVPTGLLGSSVVCQKGNGIIGAFTVPTVAGGVITTTVDAGERPLGILNRDFAGLNAFEGTLTEGVNYPCYYCGRSSLLRVSIYETRPRILPGTGGGEGTHDAGASDFVYGPGDLLFGDLFSSLLTKQQPMYGAAVAWGTGYYPIPTFAVASTENCYPLPLAEVVETAWEGTTDLIIRLLI